MGFKGTDFDTMKHILENSTADWDIEYTYDGVVIYVFGADRVAGEIHFDENGRVM